jgi:hypothetical protein
VRAFKGIVSQEFFLQDFFMNHLPQALENNIGVISNFFKYIHGDIGKSKCTTDINDNGGKFSTFCQLHRWCTLSCEYLCKFSKMFVTALWYTHYTGAWEKLILDKNLKSKIS